jgi:hypothetical protein
LNNRDLNVGVLHVLLLLANWQQLPPSKLNSLVPISTLQLKAKQPAQHHTKPVDDDSAITMEVATNSWFKFHFDNNRVDTVARGKMTCTIRIRIVLIFVD